MRKPEITSKSRAENLTAETLNKFFEMVHSIYNDKSIFEDANHGCSNHWNLEMEAEYRQKPCHT